MWTGISFPNLDPGNYLSFRRPTQFVHGLTAYPTIFTSTWLEEDIRYPYDPCAGFPLSTILLPLIYAHSVKYSGNILILVKSLFE